MDRRAVDVASASPDSTAEAEKRDVPLVPPLQGRAALAYDRARGS